MSANAPGGEAYWQAYPLTVVRPGVPHVLEVEVPNDVHQTLGISVVESTTGVPVAAGDETTAIDSGVFVSEETLPSAPKWVRHRIIFWPRTKTPIALLANRSEKTPAVYGKIRILAGPAKLPRAFDSATVPERMLAGYLSRPSFTSNFGAPQSIDASSGRALDDWQTFYFGATRLADYLQYVGYGGQMMTVMSEGSTIYPSQFVAPTPTFDSGASFESAQDPVRKDALELLLRVFDREELKLVPALKFNAPLPELEELLRRGGAEAAGIQLIGPEGQPYGAYPSRSRVTCCYNPLNERVQESVLNVVRELVQRYQQHPALAGLAVEISAESFLELPGELWGLDDDTIARFERDNATKVPGQGDKRFAERARFFAKPERDGRPNVQRDLWLKWRANLMAQFYRRLQNELTAVRRDATLYLSATQIFNAPEAARQLAPALSSNARISEVLLGMGIRADLLRDQRGMVLLRPIRLAPGLPVAEQGNDFELNRSQDVDEQLNSLASAGQLIFHPPLRTRVPSFEAKSPFGRERTPNAIASQISPADFRNRERFIHALAVRDLDTIFDGGDTLPLGQEDSLFGFIAAYRRLPVGKYATVNAEAQPVTVRTLATNNSTYAYIVNDSPWPVNVQMQLDLPPGCGVDELSGRRRLPVLAASNWTLPMEPFDLIAVKFRDPGVRVKKVDVPLDRRLETVLDVKLEDLKQRTALLGNPPMMGVLSNPSFELPSKPGQIPGWSLVNPVRGAISTELETVNKEASSDPNVPRKPVGKQALKFVNQGPSAAVHSEPFAATHTGRIFVLVWLRVDDPTQQPDVQIVIEGSRNGQLVYYRASIQIGKMDVATTQNRSPMVPFLFQIVDLPTTGLDKAPGAVRNDWARHAVDRRCAAYRSVASFKMSESSSQKLRARRGSIWRRAISQIACTCWKATGRDSSARTYLFHLRLRQLRERSVAAALQPSPPANQPTQTPTRVRRESRSSRQPEQATFWNDCEIRSSKHFELATINSTSDRRKNS